MPDWGIVRPVRKIAAHTAPGGGEPPGMLVAEGNDPYAAALSGRQGLTLQG